MIDPAHRERLRSMTIGVLMGGLSNEAPISRKSGEAALAALQRSGMKAVGVEVERNLAAQLTEANITIVFNALHGAYGEDGCVQGALELLGIPYTGSGVMASAMAMSKPMTKTLCNAIGVATPPSWLVEKQPDGALIPPDDITAPVVVKPANGGSSIAVAICHTAEEIEPAIEKAFAEDHQVLVERFIEGELITIGILGERTLPAIEIEPVGPFYDYERKYTPGETLYHIPARLNETVLEQSAGMVTAVHKALGCRGVSRSEIIVDGESKPWFIELNTLPGLTETSLLPKAAAAVGIAFDALILTLLAEAL